MIEIYKLTKRHVDDNESAPKVLKDITLFSTCVGHGVGTIDFTEKILELSDEEYDELVSKAGRLAKSKLGNLNKYFEIEIYPHHAVKLVEELQDCQFKEILKNLQTGYLVLRKS